MTKYDICKRCKKEKILKFTNMCNNCFNSETDCEICRHSLVSHGKNEYPEIANSSFVQSCKNCSECKDFFINQKSKFYSQLYSPELV